ncbi:MAG TPA: hypothetical protein VFY71_02360 [Planctomycetota bacterium]|nr:hypothetical protein [Planctomycetota bacterium]
MRALPTCLALLTLVPSALAIPASKAVAAVKASNKAHLKELKQAGAAALTELDAQLDALDGTFATDTTPSDAAAAVGDALIGFVDAVEAAYGSAVNGVVNDANEALHAFADGEILHGLYPVDFYYGTGGVLDDSKATMDKEAGKLRVAALKRIGKTIAKAEAAGLGFAVELRLPSRDKGNQVDADGGFEIIQSATIDLVLSVSRLADANDGVLVVSGISDDSDDVTVLRQHFLDAEVASVPCDPRFIATFTGLAEGGYTVGVQQGTGEPASTGSIGVR